MTPSGEKRAKRHDTVAMTLRSLPFSAVRRHTENGTPGPGNQPSGHKYPIIYSYIYYI